MGRSLNCQILVQNERPATDEEWDRWVAFVTSAGASVAHLTRVLVFSAGGSPTPKQRAKIHALVPAGGVLTAIVIGSRLARTVVKAMALFNPGTRAFAPNRLRDALEYLRVSGPRHVEVFAVTRALHAELGIACEASL